MPRKIKKVDCYRKILIQIPTDNTVHGPKKEMKKWLQHYANVFGGKHMKQHIIMMPLDHKISSVEVDKSYEVGEYYKKEVSDENDINEDLLYADD